MSSLLPPASVLDLLRDTGDALYGNPDPEAGLRRVAALLVPSLADEMVLYVVDRDGRLHARTSAHRDGGARTSGERRRGNGDGRRGKGRAGAAGAGAPDSGEGPSLAPDSDHPAAVACREGRTILLPRGGGPTRARDDPATVVAGICAVGLPLRRGGETVGGVYLGLRDGTREYHEMDLDCLEHIGARISVTLENVRLRREVQAARRVKADFLSVMSHELRTPLTAVVGYADLLEAGIPGPVTERQAQQLARIKESAWKLLELIDGILGYARYEGADPELEIGEVGARDLVRDALAVLHGGFREKGLRLTVDVDEGVPTLRTDREKASRVLFHLLSNAEKFTDVGGVRVRVDADRDWVRFSIRDTGAGIGVQDLDQIFEPFWQGERSETRTKGGTGMGLSLARRLAELLSGEIEVESTPGRGSDFTLRLPREGPHPTFP